MGKDKCQRPKAKQAERVKLKQQTDTGKSRINLDHLFNPNYYSLYMVTLPENELNELVSVITLEHQICSMPCAIVYIILFKKKNIL